MARCGASAAAMRWRSGSSPSTPPTPKTRRSARPSAWRCSPRTRSLHRLCDAGNPGHPGRGRPGRAALAFPISVAIVVLLAIVTLSYEQTIHAYPGGGGAYIVARDNLGELPAQIGRGGPADRLHPDRLRCPSRRAWRSSPRRSRACSRSAWRSRWRWCSLIMLINLRGVKESGACSWPSRPISSSVIMFLTVGIGLFRYFTGELGRVVEPAAHRMHGGEMQGLSLFLLLHAFSSGTTALTGVEAISNGITAFKEPRSRNAGITLIWMSCILGSAVPGHHLPGRPIGAVPSETETVISQLARTAFGGRGLLVSGDHRRHDHDPDHGGQHRLRRLPAAERAAGRRTASCRASSPIAAAGWCIRAASWCWP